MTQVGPDGCVYVTQGGTRYDDFTEATDDSVVRICGSGGFTPPPGIIPTPPPSTCQDPKAANYKEPLPCTYPSADLRIQGSAPASVTGGDPLTYTFTARNGGTSPAAQVLIRHSVPANVSLRSVQAPKGWTCTAPEAGARGTVSCTTAAMAPGETAIVTVNATVSCLASGTSAVVIAAAISASTPDPNLANNAVSLTTAVRTTPITISTPTVDKASLWPPNHKMTDVTVSYAVAGACGGSFTATLTVSSNEASNSAWVVLDAHHVRLEASRNGSGSGRIYTITVTVTDAGRTATRTVQVIVPHDMR
jgi:uncharacterized repeat protein (TIGR01451 family)